MKQSKPKARRIWPLFSEAHLGMTSADAWRCRWRSVRQGFRPRVRTVVMDGFRDGVFVRGERVMQFGHTWDGRPFSRELCLEVAA